MTALHARSLTSVEASLRSALEPEGFTPLAIAAIKAMAPAEPVDDAGPLAIDDVAIDRVGRHGAGYVVHGRLPTATGAGGFVVQFLDGDVGARARQESESLRKSRRGQLGRSDRGLVAVPSHGAIVRRAGLDTRIWGLGLIGTRRPGGKKTVFGQECLEGLVGEIRGAELLTHRLGKRATIRVRGSTESVVVKAYKARSEVPPRAVAWAEALRRRPGPGLSPAVLAFRPDLGLVAMEDLGSQKTAEFSPIAPRESGAIAPLLRAVHSQAGPPAPRHRPTDEIQIILGQLDLVRVVRPGAFSALAAAAARLEAALLALDAGRVVPIHRDVHPGQVCVRSVDPVVEPAGSHAIGDDPRGASACLIDLDTVSLGDPMVDLGNIAAYLDLADQRGVAERVVEMYGPSGSERARLAVWRAASKLRLTMIKLVNGSTEDVDAVAELAGDPL